MSNVEVNLMSPLAADEMCEEPPGPDSSIPPRADALPPRTWMNYARAQHTVGHSRLLRRLTIGFFARLELLVLSGHKDRSTLRKIQRCRRDAETLLTGSEAV